MSADPALINEDIRPTRDEERHWSVLNMASLWVGMVVCVPAYTLAGGLVQAGMSAWQAILTILLGNVIILIPMVLNGHPGTKYGVPFPVLARASFGIFGANIPSLIRGLVACGWFGINTWVGGSAIYQLLLAVGWADPKAADLFIGINAAELVCFLVFWAAQMVIIWRGIESIRLLETLAAPLLLLMSFALLIWAFFKAGGFGDAFAAPSQFVPGGAKEGQFWSVFLPSLTGMVGFWATLALNIPDFTRYARTQHDQVLGQALGLPTTMTLFAFIGVAVTSATTTIFGETIANPIDLVGRFAQGGSGVGAAVAAILAMFGLAVATLSTNIAANVVSPANALINLAPSKVTFRMGALVTGVVGILMLPWKLFEDPNGYIFVWLGGIGTLLGPVTGILVADYFLLRGTELDLDDLYRRDGRYRYVAGFNPTALLVFVLGVIPSLPGFLHTALGNITKGWAAFDAPGIGDWIVFAGWWLAGLGHRIELVLGVRPGIFDFVYQQAWFVGFFIGLVAYTLAMMVIPHGSLAPQEGT
ncbi:MAG: NCS1 family nucleobase:cation symporter-1 [Alphaproteobacteria bacterium]|nr:NCS1 family nucleobase:cation symporter-1 [Alphaproteobacteria bacterium]